MRTEIMTVWMKDKVNGTVVFLEVNNIGTEAFPVVQMLIQREWNTPPVEYRPDMSLVDFITRGWMEAMEKKGFSISTEPKISEPITFPHGEH